MLLFHSITDKKTWKYIIQNTIFMINWFFQIAIAIKDALRLPEKMIIASVTMPSLIFYNNLFLLIIEMACIWSCSVLVCFIRHFTESWVVHGLLGILLLLLFFFFLWQVLKKLMKPISMYRITSVLYYGSNKKN